MATTKMSRLLNSNLRFENGEQMEKYMITRKKYFILRVEHLLLFTLGA